MEPILALNSGSSSLKFGVFRRGAHDEEPILTGSATGIGRPDGKLTLQSATGETILDQDHVLESQEQALAKLAAALQQHLGAEPAAIGHRIVHGGPNLRTHQRITPQLLQQLEATKHLAPLHIPPALDLLAQAQRIFPHSPHIACFDTAFHRTLPEVAQRLPLPRTYFDQGLQRYGFHGLSYESLVHRLDSELPPRAVFAHLGNGSSLVAVRDGRSIDTTMGLTPTGGIPMGTRSGDLDPGALLFLMRTGLTHPDALEALLNHDSGLTALSNGESDMKSLLNRARQNDSTAQLAVDAFVIAVQKTIGAYAALLDGIDLLVFTGGIGEHAAELRTRICSNLAHLGLSLNVPNQHVRVLETEEERQIARHCRSLLQP
jgi:acetate kinase